MKRMGLLAGAIAASLWLAPGVSARQIPPARPSLQPWTILYGIETERPSITLRQLSAEEKAEIPVLLAGYQGKGRTTKTIQRLTTLASSGDRDAMLAVRQALLLGPTDERLAQFADTPENRGYLITITRVAAALWTAHLWELHGFEPAGVPYVQFCFSGLRDAAGRATTGASNVAGERRLIPSGRDTVRRPVLGCGFELQVVNAAQAATLAGLTNKVNPADKFAYYSPEPGGKYRRDAVLDFYVTGATFHPVWGDKTFLEEAFQRHLNDLSAGWFLDVYGAQAADWRPLNPAFKFSLAFYEGYARANGKTALVQNAIANGLSLNALSAAQAAKPSPSAADIAAQKKREEDIATWNWWMKDFRSNPEGDTGLALSTLSSSLGGKYWDEYIRLKYPDGLYPQQTADAPASGDLPYNPAQTVDVRTYDTTGTYTGSVTVSPFWADVMKMTSGAQQ